MRLARVGTWARAPTTHRVRSVRTYSTEAAQSSAKPAPAPQIGFRQSALEAFKGPHEKPVVAIAEAGSDAVLGPLVVSAVMFNPDTLAKLSSVPFPVFRTSNQAPQRRAWRDFVKEKATKQHVLETSVNELNDIVEAQVNIRQLMTTVKENAGGRPPKVTIEDVVWKKMVDTIGAMEVPDGSKVALLVPPKDLRWGGTGDVRFKQLHALRRGFLAAKFPKLEFIGSPTFYDPMWLYAAYCLAKTARDENLESNAMAQKQETGTGYMHDWRTRSFLRVYVGRQPRHQHPVNIIRYNGWNRKLVSDWKLLEEKRHQLQREEFYKQYPFMVNDPLRQTGIFRKIQDELDAKKAEEEAKRRADRIKGIIV